MNITFEKLGLNQEELAFMKNNGLLLDKRTMRLLQKTYESNYNVSLMDIANLEDMVGFNFPQDYKDFLLKYNGGHPSKSHINENCIIDYFLGVKLDYRSYTLMDNYINFSEIYGIHSYIPIAVTPSGDYILLSDKQEILLFEHDFAYSSQDELSILAHSFSELLEILY